MSKHSVLPSVSRLYQLFSLDNDTGNLLHKKKCGNNRPHNLRIATRHQNRQNVGSYKSNKVRMKGVWYDKNRKCFLCSVQSFGDRETFGPFATAEDASRVYEIVSKERFGEFYKESDQ